MNRTSGSILALVSVLAAGCAGTQARARHVVDPPVEAPPATARPNAGVDAPTGPVGPTARLTLTAPDALREEHLAIQAALIAAMQEPAPIGPVAVELARVAQPHFAREDEIAMPPLGLLPALAAGDRNPALRDVLPLTDALR
jgi:hypothetical protein